MKVKSGIWLAMEPDIDAEQRGHVKRVVEDALNVLEYRIADVGIFSDPPDLNMVPVVVSDLVAGAIEQARILQPGARERVEVDLPKDLPPVLVDPTSLARVLAHLIDNALKFSDDKPVTVGASFRDDMVQLNVVDNGIGIPAASKDRLFQPLEQGDDSATRRHGGLGMGLALVKMILDAHEIPLAIASEEGKGTTVTLELPVAQPSGRR
jgi:signal transduction histidine kinase